MVTELSSPVLDAYLWDTDGCLAVWCTHCLDWHYHSGEPGHAVAHCGDPTSPYFMSGYNLKPIDRPVPTYKNGRPRPPDGA